MIEINKIYCGDCLELLSELDDKSVDLVLTDPPFKISQSYTANIDADNLIAISSIFPASEELFRVCKDGAYFVTFYDTRILPLIFQAMRWAGWKYLRGLTFYRRWGNAHKLYGWMSTSDFILLFRKPSNSPFIFYSDDWRHDVYTKDKPEIENHGHKAQKPIDIITHLVRHLSPEKATILDPFIGSGTTAVACIRTNRNYIGMEISPEYCEIANKRIGYERQQLKLAL